MNIEEERKAFLEAMKPKLIAAFGCGCLEEGYDKDTFNNENAQEFFECWLAAKEHAAEMAKGAVHVKKRPHKLHGWGVYVGNTYHMRLAIGATKEDATQWAKDNGYRVIE